MKGKHITFLVLPALVYGLFLFIGPRTFVVAGDDHKVTICHATSSETNPFNSISVDKNSTANGHSTDTKDIIPIFTYYEWEVVGSHEECPTSNTAYGSWVFGKTCSKKIGGDWRWAYPVDVDDYDWVAHTYPGLNYDALGQAILNNGCNIPPAEEECPTECGYAGGTVNDGLGGQKTCRATETCPEAGTCPTECGYPGGTVPDGQGGQIGCHPTNSCSTYRWCFPDEESPTGYLAQAISISTPTPTEGKPWESGKMLDRYCSYEPAGTCPTECGYEGGDEVANGEGGTIECEATAVCEEPEMCKWDDKLEADDPECPKDCVYDSTISENDSLCAPIDDDEDVLGEDDEVKDTGVVLGATGPGDNLDIYLVELLLVAILASSYVFLSKKYLKNSR